jgi:hypothetical protein
MRRADTGRGAIGACVAAAVALAVLWWFPRPGLHTDEYLHLLAADGWRAGLGLRMTPEAEPYERARGFTYLVIAAQALGGPDVAAARWPSMLAGAMLAAALGAWVWRRAGGGAAALAVGLTVATLHLAQAGGMVRFYGVQTLLVFVGALAAYEAVSAARGRPRLAWGIAGVLAWAGALHVQVTSLIPLGFLVAWGALEAGPRGWRALPASRRPLAVVVLGLGALGVLAAAWAGGLLGWLWARYQTPRLWAEATADDAWFYLRLWAAWYGPWLWTLPLWAGLALCGRHRRLAAWCLALGAGPLVVHALLEVKAWRYVAYTWPFLWVLVALGVDAAARAGWAGLTRRWPAAERRGVRLAALGCVVLVLGYAGYRTPGFFRTGHMIASGNAGPFAESDWPGAAAALAPLLGEGDVVVASAWPKALRDLGRVDLIASASVAALAERRTPGWYGLAGRPVVDDADALAAWVAGHERGVVLIEAHHWGHPGFVPADTVRWIEHHLQPQPLPERYGLRAFTWGHTTADRPSTGVGAAAGPSAGPRPGGGWAETDTPP